MMEDRVSGDSVLLRELRSLREELSASQRARLERSAAGVPAVEEASPGLSQPEDAAAVLAAEGELRQLVDAIREFAEDAEKNVAAHPTAMAIGAMVLGILIGRLLGRR